MRLASFRHAHTPRVPLPGASGAKRSRAHRHWQEMIPGAMFVAPLCSLFAIFTWFLLINGDGDGNYICLSSPYDSLPRADGPDPLGRAPVLTVQAEVSTLDGSVIDDGPRSHSDSPDWRIDLLAEQLTVKHQNWKLTHPGDVWREGVLLLVERDLSPRDLRRYLYSIQLAMGDRLQLVSLAKGNHTAARVTLVPLDRWAPAHGQGPHTLQIEDFTTYGELIKEVVVRRQAGRPVFLSLI